MIICVHQCIELVEMTETYIYYLLYMELGTKRINFANKRKNPNQELGINWAQIRIWSMRMLMIYGGEFSTVRIYGGLEGG